MPPSRARFSRTIALIAWRSLCEGAMIPVFSRGSGDSASHRAATAPAMLSGFTSATLSPSFSNAVPMSPLRLALPGEVEAAARGRARRDAERPRHEGERPGGAAGGDRGGGRRGPGGRGGGAEQALRGARYREPARGRRLARRDALRHRAERRPGRRRRASVAAREGLGRRVAVTPGSAVRGSVSAHQALVLLGDRHVQPTSTAGSCAASGKGRLPISASMRRRWSRERARGPHRASAKRRSNRRPRAARRSIRALRRPPGTGAAPRSATMPRKPRRRRPPPRP